MYDTVLYYHCICKEKTFEILWSSNIILVFVNATIKFHFIVMLLCSRTNNLGQFNTKSAVLVKKKRLNRKIKLLDVDKYYRHETVS